MAPTPASSPPTRVLLVDDDRDDYLLTRDLFAEIPGYDFHLDWVADYDRARDRIGRADHDVYLLDYRLGARSGLDLLAEARAAGNRQPVIVLTGQGRFEIDRAAAAAGADDYLEKSKLDAVVLERAIRYAVRARTAEAELERKVAERTAELAAANAALRDADRRKNEFLATLAHELRNPLAPIRNAVEILRLAGGDPQATAHAREIMDRQIRQMVRMVDDLLDVSRIAVGKLALAAERLALGEVIAAAVETSRPQVEKAGVELAVAVPADPPVWLTADRVRLAQVFANLLNNAAKYTEAGGRVAVSADVDPAAGRVAVRVTDTGVGIPPDVLPHVFDLFTQVDRTLDRSQGGLGIGLALVRKFVELHGGAVEARSGGVGRGAEFVVTLPTTD